MTKLLHIFDKQHLYSFCNRNVEVLYTLIMNSLELESILFTNNEHVLYHYHIIIANQKSPRVR